MAGVSDTDAFALIVALHKLIRSLRQGTPFADLQPAQLVVLSTLLEDGPMRIGELAVRIHSSQPSATATVSNLAALGLVSREPDPADGRAIRVTVTGAGRERILSVAHGQADLLHARAAGLPATEQELLRSVTPVLRKLAEVDPDRVSRKIASGSRPG
jgi:DNA-binding MarR family transcriptional regulator